MKKRIISLLLALVILLAASAPLPWQRTLAAGTVYFTSVNDVLCALDDETMPFWSGGNLYVPSTVFSAYDLNLSYIRDTSTQTEYLYNREKIIEFDLAKGGANNKMGTYYSANALVKGGAVYFPLAFVCSYFGLNYTIVETNWAPLVRITNENVILSDTQFVDAAATLMTSRYSAYQQSKKAPAATNPDTPAQPDDPAQNGEEKDDGGNKATAKVYLALRAERAETLAGMLDTLERYSCKATIFFDPAALSGCDDVLRRAISEGHRIGFVQKEPGTAALDRGNETLRKITGTTTRLILPAEQELTAAGYAACTPSLRGETMGTTAAGQANRLFSRIENSTGGVQVLLGGDETAAAALNNLCRKLYSGQYTVRAVNEVVCGS